MDDVGQILYILFIIFIFFVSALKKGKKTKTPPAPRPKRPIPAPGNRELTPAEIFERELAKMLGVEKEPKPTPAPAPAPPNPFVSRSSLISEARKATSIAGHKKETVVEKTESVVPQPLQPEESKPKMQSSPIQERIIWAEILGPPKALRRGRTI